MVRSHVAFVEHLHWVIRSYQIPWFFVITKKLSGIFFQVFEIFEFTAPSRLYVSSNRFAAKQISQIDLEQNQKLSYWYSLNFKTVLNCSQTNFFNSKVLWLTELFDEALIIVVVDNHEENYIEDKSQIKLIFDIF